MATSPIYSWPEPDNTDLVKNGALAIRTLGNAIDTTMGTMVAKTIIDAKGDLIAGTAADTAARLAVGNNGETLVADSSTSTGLRYQGSQAAGKNYLINGLLDVWQRSTSNASFAVANSGSYVTADRWKIGSSATVSLASSQQTGDNTGNRYALRYGRVSGQTATGIVRCEQIMETVSSIPLAGKTVTLSFYAKKGADAPASLTSYVYTGTGTDQSSTYNGFTGAANTSQVNTLTATSTKFTMTATIPSNATQIAILFDYSSTGTAGANEFIQLESMQLELGSVATAFTRTGGTIQQELAACQRYYYLAATGTSGALSNGFLYAASYIMSVVQLAVPMRTGPSLVFTSGTNYYNAYINGSSVNFTGANWVINQSGTTAVWLFESSTGFGGTAGQGIVIRTANASASIAFSAEL